MHSVTFHFCQVDADDRVDTKEIFETKYCYYFLFLATVVRNNARFMTWKELEAVKHQQIRDANPVVTRVDAAT